MKTLSAGLAIALALVGVAAMAQDTGADPNTYLEDANGARALAFVEQENDRSLAVLENDPHFSSFYDQALAIATAKDRIPAASFAGDGTMRNFWQDQSHVRGVWRAASRDSYRTADPQWRTILDLDAVARAETKNWVWKGGTCLAPDDRYCLIELSDGGKDAVTVREFDAQSGQFVDGGFVSPESKQDVTWLDHDTVLIGADWGPGTMTSSGYPFIVKAWKRGTPLSAARELFRGSPDDVSTSARVLRDPDGTVEAVIMNRGLSFFESEYWLQTPERFVRLPLPLKSSIQGFVGGQLIVSLEEDWEDTVFKEGDLIAFDLNDLKANPDKAKPSLILRLNLSQSIETVVTTRDRLVVSLYENVKGGLFSFAYENGVWKRRLLPTPEDVSVDIGAAADQDNALLVQFTSFLTPTAQYWIDAASGASSALRSLPEKFDASKETVDQFWAESKDGTRVPYFVVRPKDLAYDGTAPTLLYAYGGFQISETPGYSASVGKLWLERGGVYVLANIRGGGEFGPRWHNAALKENRQKAFDDFYAVAEDLIARKITSPDHLGAMGGSNGGLLMGVALTQRPDLFKAIVIQVPLFDMIAYTHLGAGASWIGEYGDPAIPAERANLERWSPYQNLRPGMAYPEVFIDTSTKDDRVHPAHARKAAAKLKELGYPFLYYENTEGGHAAAANLNETARRVALEYTYLTRKLME